GGRQPADALEALAELLPPEQLHDEERHGRRVVDARVEDLDDELAVDVRCDLGLALEALAQLVALEHVRQHHLERAPPLRLEVEHLVHRSHAAGGDAPEDLVATGEDDAVLEGRGHGCPGPQDTPSAGKGASRAGRPSRSPRHHPPLTIAPAPATSHPTHRPLFWPPSAFAFGSV